MRSLTQCPTCKHALMTPEHGYGCFLPQCNYETEPQTTPVHTPEVIPEGVLDIRVIVSSPPGIAHVMGPAYTAIGMVVRRAGDPDWSKVLQFSDRELAVLPDYIRALFEAYLTRGSQAPSEKGD